MDIDEVVQYARRHGLPDDYFHPVQINLRYYTAQQNKFGGAGIDHREDIEEIDFWR